MFRYLFCLIFFFASSIVIAQDTANYSEDQIKLHTTFIDAKISLFKGDTTEAITSLKKLLRTEQSSIAAYLLSEISLDKKDYSTALKFGQKVNGDILVEEGYLLHMLSLHKQLNNKKSYQEVLENLIKYFPKKHDYFYNLVDVLIKRNEYKEALKLLQNKQKNRGVREAIIKRKYDIYMIQKKHNKAEKELLSLIDKYPNESAYLYNLASFYSQTNQPDKSNEIYKKILTLNPNDKSAKAILSGTTTNNNNVGGILQGLIPIADNPESNVDHVIKRLLPYIESMDGEKDQKLSKTLTLISSKLATSHPGSAKANTLYGDVLYLSGKLQECKIQYIKTLELDKSVFSVWNQLFNVLDRLGDYKTLALKSKKAMNYYPNQPVVYIYNSIASTMNNDDDDKSLEILQEAKFMLANSDNNTKQLYKIARITIFAKSNQSEKAMEILQEFENHKADLSYEMLENIGRLFDLLGDKTKAASYSKMSLDQGNPYKG